MNKRILTANKLKRLSYDQKYYCLDVPGIYPVFDKNPLLISVVDVYLTNHQYEICSCPNERLWSC